MAYSDDKTYSQLIEIGFTNQEILDLYQRESNVTGIKLKLPDKLKQIMNIDFVTPDVSERIHYEDFILYANNGDIRYQNYSINFDRIARNLGWAGGGTGAAFIIANVSKNQFARAVVSSVGLGWVSAIVSVAGAIFTGLATYNNGVTITTKSRYAYDEYEGFGKWYLVEASYYFW